MKLTQRIKAALSIVAGTYQKPDEWMWEAFGGAKTTAGVRINEKSAMNLSAVFACVSKIAKTVATLPLVTYERTSDGKARANAHPVYSILHDAPNSQMTAVTFREAMQAHVLQWGNAYARIERGARGEVLALWPLTPDRVAPFRDESKRLWYRLTHIDGGTEYLRDDEVLHVPGLGFDGVCGYSVVQMARESMGLTSAIEQFGATFFGNGASFGGFLEHPGSMTAEQITQLREQIKSRHSGENAHSIGILTGGMKYSASSIPPNDAQFLDSRKFQVVEIARWFDVPPHKIASMEAATFGNIEHQSIEWVVDTIRPWCVRWEQEIQRKLFLQQDQGRFFAKHNLEGLLRGDYKSRMEGYSIARNGGWMSANDIRELEDMNKIEGGDVYLVPVNMQAAEAVNRTPQSEPASNPQALRAVT